MGLPRVCHPHSAHRQRCWSNLDSLTPHLLPSFGKMPLHMKPPRFMTTSPLLYLHPLGSLTAQTESSSPPSSDSPHTPAQRTQPRTSPRAECDSHSTDTAPPHMPASTPHSPTPAGSQSPTNKIQSNSGAAASRTAPWSQAHATRASSPARRG